MTMNQLSEASGLTPRTIRYYVANGLLPTPKRGTKSPYSKEHLDVIRKIKEWQFGGKSLDEIRFLLCQPPAAEPPKEIPMPESETWEQHRLADDVVVQVKAGLPMERSLRVAQAMKGFFMALRDE